MKMRKNIGQYISAYKTEKKSYRPFAVFKKFGITEIFPVVQPLRAIAAWVEKAYREGTKDGTIVVMLIPARTDTRYFHDFILHRSEIRFVPGRLKFWGRLKVRRFRLW